MKKLELRPAGFTCTLEECPHGFFLYGEMVGFKSEYCTNGRPDAYCDSGEFFWANKDTIEEVKKVEVIPLDYVWVIE